ncbi:MAG: carbamoyltransferase C-terminal domain-containing protein, partial [Bdellovibrionota bacterium]|nr:carbamoyltransferase C-terminal domain-containing protein [Bdellovibrionota bacterium]
MKSNYHLGINLGHDRSVSIIKDGEIKVAIEQERLDRIKHSIGFMHQSPGKASHIQIPHESIKYCLDYLDITLDDVDTITGNMPGNDHSFDILKNNFSKKYAHKIKKVPSHHLAHAYSAYWPSGFDRAIVLIADGSGSTFNEGGVQKTESYSLYKAEGERLTLIHSELVTSHLADIGTLGFVYEYITRQAGFISKVGGLKIPEAGKLMGLAPFGSDQPNLNKWIKCNEGSYHLSISPYDILLEFESLKKRYDSGENKLYLKPLIVDLAFKVQKELEEALIHLSKLAKEETGFNNLCLAGGVALNSVANYKIYKEVGFENMFIFPAAGDNGISAGCALWSYHQSGGLLRQPLKKATLGKNYAKVAVLETLSKFEDQVDFHEKTNDEIISFSAEALSKGHILCRFEGGSEYGPRALGHRSIVADPSFEKMKDIVNGRVKFREGFRPFAPFIPKENLSDVFDINIEVPFMLVVPTIKEKYQKTLPSITHVDGTGRVQSVTKEENSYFYNLCHKVTEFRGGPPVLLNTSFNVAGQPIVETPEEAIETFLKTDIDYIVIDNFWISKKNSKVLDYTEHLDKIYHSPVPKGLSKIISNVQNEMVILDRAL